MSRRPERRRPRALRFVAAALGLLGVALLLAAGFLASRPATMRASTEGASQRATVSSFPAGTVSSAPVVSSSSAPASGLSTRGTRIIRPRGWHPVGWQLPDPLQLRIPAIGLSAPIIPLGRNSDGSIEVPASFSKVGWFKPGPEPGERGAAVIVGHFDAKSGPGVFYRLRALRKGDVITVGVRGGSLVRFEVESTMAVKKTAFPTSRVYVSGGRPALRLVTCDGTFDSSTGHYVDNYVVFARMLGRTPGLGALDSGRSAAVPLLPDLRQELPRSLDVRQVNGRFHLGFASAATNVGAGPLVIHGRRPPGGARMLARQQIQLSNGAIADMPGAGRLGYVISPDHQHWHLEPFMTYELRRYPDSKLVGHDRKTGFCLGDRYLGAPLPQAPRGKVFRTNCGRGMRQLRHIVEGISVGYGDDYAANLEGQYVDITGLPAGRYYLVHRVNSSHALVEASYGNNVSWLLLRLSWKAGSRPVRVIATCSAATQPNRCSAVLH